MLAKLTSKNQLTLPKAMVSQFPGAEYFEVCAEKNGILLKPVRIGQGEVVRAKLAELGIREADIQDAVRWARSKR